VTSSVVRLEVTSGVAPGPGVVKVLEAALHHRRKTLRNNLLLAGYPPERVGPAIEAAGLLPEIRGEAVALEKLGRLAAALEPDDPWLLS